MLIGACNLMLWPVPVSSGDGRHHADTAPLWDQQRKKDQKELKDQSRPGRPAAAGTIGEDGTDGAGEGNGDGPGLVIKTSRYVLVGCDVTAVDALEQLLTQAGCRRDVRHSLAQSPTHSLTLTNSLTRSPTPLTATSTSGWPISHPFLSSVPPHMCRMKGSTSSADWCL